MKYAVVIALSVVLAFSAGWYLRDHYAEDYRITIVDDLNPPPPPITIAPGVSVGNAKPTRAQPEMIKCHSAP